MGFEKHRDAYHALVLCLLAVWSLAPEPVDGGITSNWVRDANLSADMPLWSDVFRVPPGYNAPQQVHITQGDYVGKGVIISWITPDEPGSNTVVYWAENSMVKSRAEGIVLTYTYYNYTSGYIHHCTIERLEYDTKYYYEVGIGNTTRAFWFITPPGLGPDIPYNFGLIGDLGQTFDSNRTLTHYELNPAKGQTLLFVGDLSYADDYPFTEPQPSYSAFREASFGHGMLEIKNRTHAFFSWHRNEDEIAVEADSVWLLNRYWHSLKEPSPYKDCSLKPDLSSLVYNS
ncbi:hypothetical protein SAY87_011087 [Trapa incisa]|uniref:acid phosphatase n=1 Tax=Trapa incisa TaxID=236973 RepID=A0AAN7JIU5_9MYRT|nr:hypothetical protein SAY87_011087 [Trapa incisa]